MKYPKRKGVYSKKKLAMPSSSPVSSMPNVISDSSQNMEKDYYEGDNSRKKKDFYTGFFTVSLLVILSYLIVIWILAFFNSYSRTWDTYYLYIISAIALIILYFKTFRKRRYILIGFISAILFCLLFYGACLLGFFGTWG